MALQAQELMGPRSLWRDGTRGAASEKCSVRGGAWVSSGRARTMSWSWCATSPARRCRWPPSWCCRPGHRSGLPRLRQRQVDAPFGCGRPVWVDDPSFDIGHHVRSAECNEERVVMSPIIASRARGERCGVPPDPAGDPPLRQAGRGGRRGAVRCAAGAGRHHDRGRHAGPVTPRSRGPPVARSRVCGGRGADRSAPLGGRHSPRGRPKAA